MAVVLSLLFNGPSVAVELEFVQLARGDIALRITGPITARSAEVLGPALEQVPVNQDGLRPVLLASPGGSVADALRMGQLLRAAHAHTVVGWGDTCASACASVLFLSGVARTVVGDGTLEFHTCFNSATGQQMLVCNDLLAQQIVSYGISYGDLGMWMMNPDPNQTARLNSTMANCGGLTLWPYQNDGIRRMSRCAQAGLFGRIVDDAIVPNLSPIELGFWYDSAPGARVPQGMSPSEFAYTWQPQGRWSNAQLFDGLRAFIELHDPQFGIPMEMTISCSHDYPGHLFLSYRFLQPVQLPPIRFVRLDTGATTEYFDTSNGRNIQVFQEVNGTEVILLLDTTTTHPIISYASHFTLSFGDYQNQLAYQNTVAADASRVPLTNALQNCTGQFRH